MVRTGPGSEPEQGPTPTQPAAPESRPLLGGGAIGPFGEMLTIGLVVSVLSVPVITFLPAFAAGTAHLNRHLTSRADSLRLLLEDAWSAFKTGWLYGTAFVVLLGILGMNIIAGINNIVPGGTAIAGVSGILAVGVVIVGLRSASLWRAGVSWRELIREGVDVSIDDPLGSFMVVVALFVCAVVIWMLAPLAVLTPGMLVLAMLSIERRRARRS